MRWIRMASSANWDGSEGAVLAWLGQASHASPLVKVEVLLLGPSRSRYRVKESQGGRGLGREGCFWTAAALLSSSSLCTLHSALCTLQASACRLGCLILMKRSAEIYSWPPECWTRGPGQRPVGGCPATMMEDGVGGSSTLVEGVQLPESRISEERRST